MPVTVSSSSSSAPLPGFLRIAGLDAAPTMLKAVYKPLTVSIDGMARPLALIQVRGGPLAGALGSAAGR